MTKAKRKRLEAKGWKIGTTKEFLSQKTPSFTFSVSGDFSARDKKKASDVILKAVRKLPSGFFKAGVRVELWGAYGDSPLWTTTVS